MTARYQVIIRNQEGEQVGFLTDESPELVSLYYTHLRNTPGQYRLEVDGSLANLFEVDGQIIVQRRAVEYGITEWYPEWAGFHVSEGRRTLEDGRRRFISEGFTYLDLVRRETVAYKAGEAYTTKSGVGETVIKQFVEENIGPSSNSPDRLDNGVMPGLMVQPDLARGLYWQGSRAWRNLLETCQEISEATRLAFDIVEVYPLSFVFNVYDQRRGSDRSTVDLNPSTRRNGAGNFPVRFSLSLDNMRNPSLQTTRSDVVNIVYALGAGEKSNRAVLPVKDLANIALSPWNHRAITRNASQEVSLAGLQSVGEEVLNERAARSVLTFQPMQTFSTVYGRDYFFGDRVTAEYEGQEYHLEIVKVEVTVNEEGEDLGFAFQ